MLYRVVITQGSDMWQTPTFVSEPLELNPHGKELYRKMCGLPGDEPIWGNEGMQWSGGSRDFEGMGVWLVSADDFNREFYKR